MGDNPARVPAADVIAASSDMLQKQLYAIFTTPTDGLGAVFAGLEEHLGFQVSLEKEGVLYAAGPMWTEDGEEWAGEGLVVVRAGSVEEATAIAERDPMHRSGAQLPREAVDDQRRQRDDKAGQLEPDLHADLKP